MVLLTFPVIHIPNGWILQINRKVVVWSLGDVPRYVLRVLRLFNKT